MHVVPTSSTMPEDSTLQKRRERHFWKWVTDTKNVSKGDIAKDFKKLDTLRAEHSTAFPHLYASTKSFGVNESVRLFHRKVLKFNIALRESDDFSYNDEMFDNLPLVDDEIDKNISEKFMKHYFASYKSFTKHGGVSDHRLYQMHYLDRLLKNYKNVQRKNKYAIKKAQKQEQERLQKLEKKRVKEQEKERLRIEKSEKKELRKKKLEETEKRRVVKKLKLDNELGLRKLNGEELKILNEDREERVLKQKEDSEKNIMDDFAINELDGTTREKSKVKPHNIGKLGDFNCKFCKALLWKGEPKTLCCNSGQVPPIIPSDIEDEDMIQLYEGKTKISERFLKNIVGFNLVFSFTSSRTSGKLENDSEKAMTYKIQGKIYHRIGYLKPERLQASFGLLSSDKREDFWNKKQDGFLDLYFYHDVDQQIKFRTSKITSGCSSQKGNDANTSTARRQKREMQAFLDNEEIVRLIFSYLTSKNKCLSNILKEIENSKELIRLHEEKTGKVPEVSINLKTADGVQTREHKGVYHLPTSSSSVGAIVNLDGSKRHLQVTIESSKPNAKYKTKIISHENVFYDAFQYPLLIPNGDMGYSHSMKLISKHENKNRVYDRLTSASYYCSLYMERDGIFNYMTKCRRLFQQFVVDNYVKVETMRLSFIENNQSNIRKERSDILQGENGKHKGQRIIIPPSYVGGPRYMKQRQQDALAYVSNYGSPDFFITFTMNPAWTELEEAASQTKSTSTNKGDRPDLVSRIFKIKVDSLIDDLTVRCIFGKVKAYLYSIEWQRRGLPHVHILLWMRNKVNAELVSKMISAEIPDKTEEPRLFEIVTKCLIHGPCKGFDESHLCCQVKSKEGKNCCGKGFPKPCRDTLLFGNNGYPLYKRRAIGEGGQYIEKCIKGKIVHVDNSWVVPYNPYLCLKYDAHINVECSNSIKAIAYVTKYVNKGCDRILYTKTRGDDEVINEVKNYQDARYINANEATWKIFKFPIHKSFPPVMSLDLHLEGENEIFFKENENSASLKRKAVKDTQLTAFFNLCKENEFAASLHYHEVPNHFLYNKATSKWSERKTRTMSLGRIRAVSNKAVELFYLRLLLTHIKGPTCYKDLRTIEGVTYDTYREAVKAMGLLNDEETWLKTIMEIISYTNNRDHLRTTYASMLVFSDLEDQSNIWEETKDLFSSDYLFMKCETEYNDEIYRDALDDIQEKVYNCGGCNIVQYGLPSSRNGEKVTNIVRREKSYNKPGLAEQVKENVQMMNEKQKYCYDTIMERIENGDKYPDNGFFINAPGGTGKSFLLNALLDTVRSKEKVALAVASSGIAATVLHGGRTAHNMFKIPIMEHNEVRSCNVKRYTEMSNLLKMTSLIVWDEAVMANKNTITALDITLRDILDVKKRFMGGVVFVCAGDFRQILPVVRGGGRSDEIDCCIKSSYFWEFLTHLELTQNVRLKTDDVLNIQFAKELLEMGKTHNEEYTFPPNFGVTVDDRKELVKRVYDNFEDNFLNASYFEKRAIISPTNDDVDCKNDMVFERLNTEEKIYRSEDTSVNNEMDIQTSVYNSIDSPSIPLHLLKLKVGAVVMVMRNIYPPKLCNGTRIIVTDLQKNIIVGNILTGAYRGEQVMLPRITLESTDTSVIFKRKQFPVKLCYAMTINKSQGQTFDRCGLLLDSAQCFAHGQLYVACSRVTSHDSLIVYTGYRKENDGYKRKPARNCVYKELLSSSRKYDKGIITDGCKKQSTIEDFRNLNILREEEVAIAEEEPDQSIVVLPSISEQEAVTMIMPDEFYKEDYSGDRDSNEMAEMVAEIYEKMHKEWKDESEKREKELKDENEKLRKELKDEKEKREKELKSDNEKMKLDNKKIKQILYKIINSSDEVDDETPPKKRMKI